MSRPELGLEIKPFAMLDTLNRPYNLLRESNSGVAINAFWQPGIGKNRAVPTLGPAFSFLASDLCSLAFPYSVWSSHQ